MIYDTESVLQTYRQRRHLAQKTGARERYLNVRRLSERERYQSHEMQAQLIVDGCNSMISYECMRISAYKKVDRNSFTKFYRCKRFETIWCRSNIRLGRYTKSVLKREIELNVLLLKNGFRKRKYRH